MPSLIVSVEDLKEGDLVYITSGVSELYEHANPPHSNIVGWYKQDNKYLVHIFGKGPKISGVFLKLELTNDSGKCHWYNVIISDKIYMFNRKQISKAI